MKKIISVLLAIVVSLSVLQATVYAKSAGTGLVTEKWEDLINSNVETTFSASSIYRAGDLNGDGWVTALDVRECLQIVAEIDTGFDLKRKKAADVNGDGEINSLDIRAILQMVGDIKSFNTTAETTVGDTAFDGLVVGPLESSGSSGYVWGCSVDKEGLEITEKMFSVNPDPEIIGNPARHYFAFKPSAEGTYTITFLLTKPSGDVVDEFKCVLTVK